MCPVCIYVYGVVILDVVWLLQLPVVDGTNTTMQGVVKEL